MTARYPAFLGMIALTLPAHAGALARTAAALPAIDAPPQGEMQWVARSMRVNGLAMTLRVFQSRLGPDSLLSHYESWAHRRASGETRRSVNPPWRILSIRTRDFFMTIQARAAIGGSEGTITVSPRLERAPLRVETRFPRPAGTTIVNLQEYDDFGVESEHISLVSARSVTTELAAFSQLLAREGWALIREQRGREARHTYVLEAQKGAEHAFITLQPDRTRPAASAIVIVWRKR